MGDESIPEVSNKAVSDAPSVNGATGPRPRGRPRKDGRPPGSVPLSEQAPGARGAKGQFRRVRIEYDRESIAKQLKGTHYIAGMAFGLPEFFLEDKEALELAEALIGFAREFDLEPDGKVMAALNLIAVSGFIYVPKAIHAAQRIQKMKREKAGGVTIDGTATSVETAPNGKPAVN
jgi:hypothetical protein